MEIKKLIKSARARFEMLLLSRGNGVTEVSKVDIPKERENFPNSTDEWQSVDLPESANATTCMYYAKKGNYFPPHTHADATEQLIILNPEGRIRVITNEYIREYSYPESVFFKKGEPHAVQWLEDTSSLIIWNPAFKKGWEAEL